MGNVGDSSVRESSNGAVLGRYVKGGGAVGAFLRHQEPGGDGGDAQGTGGVPPQFSATDHGDDRETQGRRKLGSPLSSRGTVICGDTTHWGEQQEAAGDHSEKGGLPPHI